MLDPDPESMNPNLEHYLWYLEGLRILEDHDSNQCDDEDTDPSESQIKCTFTCTWGVGGKQKGQPPPPLPPRKAALYKQQRPRERVLPKVVPWGEGGGGMLQLRVSLMLNEPNKKWRLASAVDPDLVDPYN